MQFIKTNTIIFILFVSDTHESLPGRPQASLWRTASQNSLQKEHSETVGTVQQQQEVHWTVATIRAVVLLVLLLPLLLCESVCVYIPKKERGVLRVVLWCGVNLCEIYILGSWRTAEFDRQHIHTHIHRERERERRGGTNERTSKQAINKSKGGNKQQTTTTTLFAIWTTTKRRTLFVLWTIHQTTRGH